MISRCQPPRRRYSELCNRSGSFPVPSRTQACKESLEEDYWEDASVSIRPCRSWGPSSSPWLHASALLRPPLGDGDGDGEVSQDAASRRSRPCRYSFDASDHYTSARAPRCFPPPLASCSTLSIKEGGRFVLKEMDADRPHGFFRAQRENGRFILQFVLSEESSDELEALQSDGGNQSDVSDDGLLEDDDASVVERLVGSVASISDQVLNLQDAAAQALHGGLLSDHPDCLLCETDTSGGYGCHGLAEDDDKKCEHLLGIPHCEGGVLHGSVCFRNDLKGAESQAAGADACFVMQDMCKDAGDDGNHLVIESKLHVDEEQDTGLRKHECVWDVDAANCTPPGLGLWSPNPMCLHPPLVKMPTVYGLAMS